MRALKLGIISVFLCVMAMGAVWASEDQVAMERSFAERAQQALDSVYGPGVFFVTVSVEMTAPQYSVKYTEQSNPKLVKKQQEPGEKFNILPGYPVLKNLAPADLNRLPFDSVTSYLPGKVQKVVVDLYVDKGYSRARASKAVGLIKEVLNLKEGRDAISLHQQQFYKKAIDQQTITIARENPQLFTYQNLFYLLVLILMLLFMILYVLFQLRKKPEVAAQGGGNSTSVNVNPNIEMPKGMGGPSGDLRISQAPPIKQYFDFVHEGNVDKVNYILKKEATPIEQIAVLISYLNGRVATRVLKALDDKQQAVVAVQLLNQQMIQKPLIDKLETQVKSAMECLTGGEEIFREIFDYVSGEDKKKLLKQLGEANPDGYRKVRSNIIIFDDLKYLENEEVKLVLSEVSVETLSVALSSADEETYGKINSNLTRSAKDMLAQFLELKGANVPKRDVERAQAAILDIVGRLEQEGKINLKGKIQI